MGFEGFREQARREVEKERRANIAQHALKPVFQYGLDALKTHGKPTAPDNGSNEVKTPPIQDLNGDLLHLEGSLNVLRGGGVESLNPVGSELRVHVVFPETREARTLFEIKLEAGFRNFPTLKNPHFGTIDKDNPDFPDAVEETIGTIERIVTKLDAAEIWTPDSATHQTRAHWPVF